ncbi:MAG: hypothetical protein M3342_25315 [Bacteroidota bacterium]|nr:hypothetical protein [Flavisolibacter sp.]MDQ3847308.1 hypothetical protein [Bacteroidota bacterium]MBD0284027.1 hypothetical protein [Flavisolibacter sp.]MBD0296269.1 hypothetical protein [Flavisolibacter sp.]MBD0351972.1 hypothetical protein [Flavisolibacter sp.]
MNRNGISSLGAFHPILFFVIVYAISLFLAFFVCRTVYFTLHGDPDQKYSEQMQKELKSNPSAFTVAAFK